MKVGTSVGTNDLHLIPLLTSLLEARRIDYIELHARYDATIEQLIKWREMTSKCGIIIHAPYDITCTTSRRDLAFAYEVEDFIIENGPIIFNAGVTKMFNIWEDEDSFLPENMPLLTKFADKGSFYSPTQVKGGFCLDFAHAQITANLLGLDIPTFIDEFIEKKPKHFHISDIKNNYSDKYIPLGMGLLPSKYIVNKLPKDARITIETEDDIDSREEAIIRDIDQFHAFIDK